MFGKAVLTVAGPGSLPGVGVDSAAAADGGQGREGEDGGEVHGGGRWSSGVNNGTGVAQREIERERVITPSPRPRSPRGSSFNKESRPNPSIHAIHAIARILRIADGVPSHPPSDGQPTAAPASRHASRPGGLRRLAGGLGWRAVGRGAASLLPTCITQYHVWWDLGASPSAGTRGADRQHSPSPPSPQTLCAVSDDQTDSLLTGVLAPLSCAGRLCQRAKHAEIASPSPSSSAWLDARDFVDPRKPGMPVAYAADAIGRGHGNPPCRAALTRSSSLAAGSPRQ